MVRLFSVCLFLLPIAASGCADTGHTVWVNLRTDYVPQDEFDEVRVFLSVGDGSEEVLTHLVEPLDYVSGQRVVVFEGLAAGDFRIRAQLHAGNTIVGSRTLTFVLAQNTNATLVVTRSCTGVVCPAGDPSATECAGGRCVSPDCSVESPELCAEGCADNSDCLGAPPCAEGLCTEEGSCVFTRCLAPDAGPGPDAGRDSGPPPTYMWSAGEFGVCSASCGAGEESRTVTCVDSMGGAVEASLCAGTQPETSRPCDMGSSTCGFDEWSAFDRCDGSCTQTQTRTCNAPGHCVGDVEQTRDCSGGDCCPSAGATCGPTTYRRSGGWICREDGIDFNVLFYAPYIFTERRCNSSRTCVSQDLARNLECICSTAGPGCTSSTSGCGVHSPSLTRCRDVAASVRGSCPNTAAHADCF